MKLCISLALFLFPTKALVTQRPLLHSTVKWSSLVRSQRIRHNNLYSSSKSITDNIVKPKNTLTDMAKTLWDFSRPHTVIGSFLSIISLFAFATPPNLWLTKSFASSSAMSVIPAILVNIYITGLNQITDVEIDKVNKPYLPIAAGKMSVKTGSFIVLMSLLISSVMGYSAAWPLQSALFGTAFLGTIYSLPPFRLKRFPILAALCILVVRGSLINLGFFFQAKGALLGKHFPSMLAAIKAFPESLLLTSFFAVFGLIIAIMKDVPDIEGDRRFGIKSFSVRIGPEIMFKVSWVMLSLLLSSTACAVFSTLFAFAPSPPVATALALASGGSSSRLIASLSSSLALLAVSSTMSWLHVVCRTVVSGSLLAFAVDVTNRAKAVDAKQSVPVFDFYMHVWKIFYACYLLLPLLAF
eukprot:gene11553-24164_t